MSVEDILKTEFSETFVKGMRDRMVVSFHKYGKVAQAKGKVNFIASLTDRLRKYAETGNTEWLIDAANFAMIEFMHPSHPEAHFAGTDADASPGRILARSNKVDHGRNEDIGKNYKSPLNQFRE
jgi:hypothetical protein